MGQQKVQHRGLQARIPAAWRRSAASRPEMVKKRCDAPQAGPASQAKRFQSQDFRLFRVQRFLGQLSRQR